MSATLLSELAAITGEAHVLQAGDLSAYELDWRKRYRGKALAVVRPATTQQVAEVMQACARHRISLVPQGGNTGLVGGSVPDASGRQVVLNLGRMAAVRRIDAANLAMTVEAGCILHNAQAAATEQNLMLPLSLAAEGSCTIGGNLATNAGGTQVLRYGNARELCLGLEVVTADGRIWDGLTALRKDNTGYDLRDLYIGSEGTLGIITAAVLKLYPQPAARMTALAACDSLQYCTALLQLSQARAAADLTGFEAMNAHSLDLVRTHFPQLRQPLAGSAWTVLLELSDAQGEAPARERFEQLLAEAMERGLVRDAAVASSLAQSREMWHLRESIPLAQAEEGLNIKHDISVPVSRMAEFVAHADAVLSRRFEGVRLVTFGHLGDGNLHYNVQAPRGGDPAAFLRDQEDAVNQVVYDAVMAHEGSISAEHGVGALKREELVRRKSPVALDLMRAIKRALDPQDLLNPGRVL